MIYRWHLNVHTLFIMLGNLHICKYTYVKCAFYIQCDIQNEDKHFSVHFNASSFTAGSFFVRINIYFIIVILKINKRRILIIFLLLQFAQLTSLSNSTGTQDTILRVALTILKCFQVQSIFIGLSEFKHI